MESSARESPERPARVSTGQLIATLGRAAIEIGLMFALLPVALLAGAVAAHQQRRRDDRAGEPS